jgi:hypothetical protein
MRALKLLCALSILASAAACGGAVTPPASSRPASPSSTPAPTPASSPSTAAAPTSAPNVVVGQAHDGLPGITYTLPASGWRNSEFGPMKGDDVKNVPEAAVLLWPFKAGSQFYVYGDPCKYRSTKPAKPATTVDQIVSSLAAQPSRDATKPVDVTVGGYAGKSITLHVPADAAMTGEDFTGCEDGKFASYGTADDPLSRYHQGPGQIDELWIVDVDGATVIIDAMYRSDTPADVIEELQRIAQSATFVKP